jgi:lipoprotein-releasing system permease protein
MVKSETPKPRWEVVVGGILLALGGTALLVGILYREGRSLLVLGGWLFGSVTWGSWLHLVSSVGALVIGVPAKLSVASLRWLYVGAASLAVGLTLVGLGLHQPRPSALPLSPAAGAPLYAPLRKFRDFYWGTLVAYSLAMAGSELCFVVLQIFLSGGRAPAALHLSPTGAFFVALTAGGVVAFIGGFLGAARAGRLSIPEATIGVIYFGAPLPFLLTLLTFDIGGDTLAWSVRLREIIYVAALLGRPELGYWLVWALLVVALSLGIATGFAARGSGELDVKLGFELYVARRHVSVFRPSLLLGALVVLLFGIIPPLLVYFMLRSAEEAVERTRIREVGLVDPLRADEALHNWKERAQSPTAMMTALSVGGVGVGVMALIIVLSVMSGFEADLKEKILGTNAHAVILKYADPFPEYQEVMKTAHEVRGVTGTTPFILNEVMLSSEGSLSGVMLKGIDPPTVGQVSDLPRNIQEGGKLEWLSHPEQIVERWKEKATEPGSLHDELLVPAPAVPGKAALPGIIIGRELAHSLRVGVGERVNVVSPLGGELGPHGPTPKSRPFRVAGIFYSGMFEYDSKFAYIDLHEAQAFFNVKGVTGIELQVADVDDARRISQNVVDALHGYPYRAKDWGEMNRNLFSALRVEKLAMGIILTMIVVVAAGLIVATVIMLVLEKRKEIAVLKALGVPDAGIVKIFLAEGLQIGVAGGLLGLLSGLAWCAFIERVGIKLDPQVYYIPALPVRVEPLQTALAVIIAVLITYLANIYPALKASQVEPVEGLKAE